MEKGIHYIENVFEYNDLLGVETLHPLVSVIDLSKAHPMKHVRHIFGFYAIFLKEVKCGDLLYGRQHYDYQEGTLVCLAPGQVIGIEDNGEVYQPKGWALVFHPDLVRGTSLGRNIREYSFFSYEVNEALHLSEREREMVVGCFLKIRQELEAKYGSPTLDDGRKDEQCIYRNGNSFTLKSGVMSVRWKDDETSTTTDLNLVHFQSCPSNLSSGMVSTQPRRSLSIQRRPAPAKASGLF